FPKIFFLALHPIATAFNSSTLIASVVEPATWAPSLPAEPTPTRPTSATAATLLTSALLFIVVPFCVLLRTTPLVHHYRDASRHLPERRATSPVQPRHE